MSIDYIPYNNPNLSLKNIKDFFSLKNKESELIEFFKNYTGKKYILPTFSCRSALYLAYRSLNKTGGVITSPLTCLTAILPVIHSNNTPVFIDIDEETYNFKTDLIEEEISEKTIALQVIHFAGYPCDMETITRIAKKKNIYIVEDCAQAFGAKYKNINVGSFGDISCFSLAKNLYGIVGGIYATDIEEFYLRAKKIQEKFEEPSQIFLLYRFLRNYLKANSRNFFYRFLYKKLIQLKNFQKSSESEEDISSLTNYLKKPDKKFFNISLSQIKKIPGLHKQREQIAEKLIEQINKMSSIKTPQNNKDVKRSFVKFYISGNFDSQKDIINLNSKGIEARHLEEDDSSYYQIRFDKNPVFKDNKSLARCTNYLKIHDKLISLPLSEGMTNKDVKNIIDSLSKLIHNSLYE